MAIPTLDPTEAWQDRVPVPILPAHRLWVDLYWQAWPIVVSQTAHLLSAAHTGVLWNPDFPVTGQLLGLTEQNDQVVAVLRYLERSAVATSANSPTWTPVEALRLILLLVCRVIGITTSLSENRITWHLAGNPPTGLRNISLGGNRIDLVATTKVDGGAVVMATAEKPFQLEIDTGFTTFFEQLPLGRHRLLLTHLDRTDVRQV